jgi:hypothetical protein
MVPELVLFRILNLEMFPEPVSGILPVQIPETIVKKKKKI